MNSGKFPKQAQAPTSSNGCSCFLDVRSIKTLLFGPLDIRVKKGECISIQGPSGSGKSIFLRAIVDLDPNEGEVWLNGVERSTIPAYEWRRKIMLVPAESGWWGDHVGDHFNEPDGNSEMLAALDLPPDVMAFEVARLSSGERQRLALARSLSMKPEMLLLDEPTAALDQEAAARVEALLHQEMDRGVGIILVTHDGEQAERLAGKSYILEHGLLSIKKDV